MDEAEKARRRKLALQKLARVFKGDEPARVPASNAYGVLAERKILTTILRTTHARLACNHESSRVFKGPRSA